MLNNNLILCVFQKTEEMTCDLMKLIIPMDMITNMYQTLNMKRLISVLVLPLFFGAAHAQQQATAGKVGEIDAVAAAGGAPNNFDFRVYLAGNPTLCVVTNQGYWAYINTTDANYKTITTLVTAAYLTGRTVALYATPVNGYCQITYLALLNP